MKITALRPVEMEAAAIRMELPVRYGDEDMPEDFQFRHDDVWNIAVDILSGQIRGWEADGQKHEVTMKVCDSGVYELLAADGTVLARLEDYVPSCVPNSYGDYVEFCIDEAGVIVNWKNYCNAYSVSKSFFPKDEE